MASRIDALEQVSQFASFEISHPIKTMTMMVIAESNRATNYRNLKAKSFHSLGAMGWAGELLASQWVGVGLSAT